MESAKDIWKKALGELQGQVSQANYATWLTNSHGLSCHDRVFVVGVPNVFVAEWLSKRLYPLIRKTLVAIIGQDVDVQFEVHNRDQPSMSPLAHQTDGGTSSKAPRYRLNPKYTFGDFVVSDCNRLAYATALEIAENLGSSYNPLFLYSTTGQGKTHLLHAIGHLTTARGLQTYYTTAEQFADEFVFAVRENQIDRFRSKFRSIDVFLFDDLHFLIGKKQTMQCFLHTFNELYSNDRQIVITADSTPKDMQPLSSKLKSRLEGGLVVDIQPPDFETRLSILRFKAKTMMTAELEGVLHIVADKVRDNVRQLEGALVYIVAQARLSGTRITPETVHKLLTGSPPRQDIRLVLDAVADHFGISTEDLISKKRDRKTAMARHIAIYLMRETHHCSLTGIGKTLGDRNHATILHSYEKIAGELRVDPTLAGQIAEIQERLGSHNPPQARYQSV